MRARILAGVATIAVASMALPSSEASAQLGACPVLQPPPCIVIDPSAIAQHVADINQKRQQVEEAINTVRQYTDTNNILGQMGRMVQDAPSPAGWVPIDPTPRTTFEEAANALDAHLVSNPNTTEGNQLAYQQDILRQRAAAGEGYATALAVKARLADIGTEAQQLCRVVVTSGNKGDPDLRSTWQINRNARALMLRAVAANREVMTAQLNLYAMRSIAAAPGKGEAQVRNPAAPTQPAQAPRFRLDLAKLANAANRLAALYGAAQIVGNLTGAIKGNRATQQEHAAMVTQANNTQAALQKQARRDAQRGVSAAALIQRADQVMAQRDHTVWDDPAKGDVTKRAAKYTESQLDRMVKGDVSDNWSRLLMNRAEAFKQEAFFRPIAEDARRMEGQAREALAEYAQSLGVDPTNPTALQEAIRHSEAEVSDLRNAFADAPPDIIRQRDAIIASSGMTPPK